MIEYRITKYDPDNRINGKYTANEWTGFGDIGKTFDGAEFTYEKYLETETAYIDCCIDLMSQAIVSGLSVERTEYYSEDIHLPDEISDGIELRKAIAHCLRERCWFKLTGENFFIHFGYDYYIYIGTLLPDETVVKTAVKYGLFCERYPSPYSVTE